MSGGKCRKCLLKCDKNISDKMPVVSTMTRDISSNVAVLKTAADEVDTQLQNDRQYSDLGPQLGVGANGKTTKNIYDSRSVIGLELRGHGQIIFVTVNGIGPLTARPPHSPLLNGPPNLSQDFLFSRTSHTNSRYRPIMCLGLGPNKPTATSSCRSQHQN